MKKRTPDETSTRSAATVAGYIDDVPDAVRERFVALCALIRATAPQAVERISYGIPTWWQGENLIHAAAFKAHIGIYPGSGAIEAFADELTPYKTAKGTIQIPHEAALPTELVRRIVLWRLEQAAAKKPKRRTPRPAST